MIKETKSVLTEKCYQLYRKTIVETIVVTSVTSKYVSENHCPLILSSINELQMCDWSLKFRSMHYFYATLLSVIFRFFFIENISENFCHKKRLQIILCLLQNAYIAASIFFLLFKQSVISSACFLNVSDF